MIFKALISAAIFTLLFALSISKSKNDAQSQPLTEPVADQIACVSYAPYRLPGESPFEPNHQVDEARIAEDLKILSALTRCVRTYSTQRGLQAVPKVARELGMSVYLGVWIGRNDADNRQEITTGIELANAYPNTITGVIVGNEVLLRREQTPDAIAQYLDQVRGAITTPVTYADVWEFWVQNKALAEHVDYLTIHILPYWEDEPVGIAHAVGHVADVFTHVQADFPGRKMMIGETGWPSFGRQRGPAQPSRLAQAEFIRAWVNTAQMRNIDYNLIEAFDQPWKRSLEGAMGGHWGMLDSNGKLKFPWRGDVSENPTIMHDSLLAAGLMLFIFVTTSLGLRRLFTGKNTHMASTPTAPLWQTLAITTSAGLCGGALIPTQWHYLSQWNRYLGEWAGSALFWVVGLLLALLTPTLISRSSTIPSIRQVKQSWRNQSPDRLACLASCLRMALLFGMALFMVLHAFDARYRGFALPLYVLPFGVILSFWVAGHRIEADALEERWAGLVALICVPFMLSPELPSNTDAILLAAMVVPIALYALLPRRNNSILASNTAAAPGSTE